MVPSAKPGGSSVEDMGPKVLVGGCTPEGSHDVVEGVVVGPGTKAPAEVMSRSTSKNSSGMRRRRTHAPESNSPTLQLISIKNCAATCFLRQSFVNRFRYLEKSRDLS
jgi:hypothetical protein